MDRPRYHDSSNARFTEHLSSSPPYNQYIRHSVPAPEVVEYDTGPTGYTGSYTGSQPWSKERPTSTSMSSPGLESVMDEEGHKEVVSYGWQQQYPVGLGIPGHATPDERTGRTYCGLSRKRFVLILSAILLIGLAISLGVGLGVGLSQKKSSSNSNTAPSDNTEYLIGGAIDPSYYTHTGAFNGSGIALASQSFTKDLQTGTQGSIVMYFQHHTGEIRWIQLSSAGDWLGGSVSEIVAVDAKNSTPLSAVSYSIEGQNTWHIFYIDTHNTLKQRTNSNTTNVWIDGPINDLSLKVYDSEQVGMQACWYGNDYGDSDYTHTPLPNQNTTNGNPALSNQVGMHMWYAADETTFHQYGWRDGDSSWQHQNVFTNMNGHCGVGCYSWGPGTVTYVMMVNEKNAVEVYWKDTNTNLTSTKKHPINEWVKSSVKIEDVNPATSLGYTNYFYAQLEDNMIHGYNISWAAENSTIMGGSEFIVEGDPGISGTHLSVSAIPNSGGGNSIIVFYQIEGNDITEYTRDLVAGQWSSLGIPIPNQ